MHRFPSKSTIHRFRLIAFLLCFRCLAVPVAIGLLIYSFIHEDHALIIAAMGLGVVCVLMSLLQWLLAGRARCPLCMTSVLASRGCAKHRNARTLLGSYRLRVAMAILFRGAFYCPYCHEPSAMEVRSRRANAGATHY